jgi:hypothetical protein
MTTWVLVVIIAGATLVLAWLLWLMFRPAKNNQPATQGQLLSDLPRQDIERIFDDEFREELRNQGRLYFKQIINENAMFLQQDLRLTTSQLNDYMKDEIKRTLQEEFAKYSESITTAKDLAIETIQKTQAIIEQQRKALEKQLNEEVATEKQRILDNFEKNMADIVNHYILTAIGQEIDLTAQLDYIFKCLEDNKETIIEDIKSGT